MVARAQLVDAGWGRAAINRLIAHGRLHRLHRGVYSVGHRGINRRGRWLAAVLAAGHGAVASHHTAGAIWELVRWEGSTHVTVPRKLPNRAGLTLHQGEPPEDEITVRHGIPVTTVARTLLDLAAVLPRDRLEKAIHEAEFRRYADSPSLPDLFERHRGARGLAQLRAIAAQRDLGERVTRSELEHRFLTLIHEKHLPRPEVNFRTAVRDGWLEANCAWPAQRLIAELDGRAAHETARAFERDRERDRLLQAAGWRVVRLTWRQLHDEPDALTRDLRRLLRAR